MRPWSEGRRLIVLALAGALLVTGCGGGPGESTGAQGAVTEAPATDPPVAVVTEAPTEAPTPAPTRATVGPSLEGTPGSLGQGVLYHIQFATDIDPQTGVPRQLSDRFPTGTTFVVGLLGWGRVKAGTELRVRLYQGDRLLYDDRRTTVHEQDSGVLFAWQPEGGFEPGVYTAQVDYNGVPDEVSSFVVGDDIPSPEGASRGTGSASGPIPYKDPAQVLVVTRFAVLRQTLGADFDAVLAAAQRVGTVVDLDADGTARSTLATTVPEVHRLLGTGQYRYLLILGNDDTVPFGRVPNPLAQDEESAVRDWELPADWVASDDPYTDLDGDKYGVPDLPTARIPSSDDAQLLLTQLGEVTPPDGGAVAIINQKRRSQAAAVTENISRLVRVETRYVPPVTSATFAASTAGEARFLYVLLHGIGVTTNEWSADVLGWSPYDPQNLYEGEWKVASVPVEAPGVGIPNPGLHGLVAVGACYGAWTLDTVQEPQHKTADNNLALNYLKSGARAFVGDTHLSYSTPIGADGPFVGRTGFEVIFWKAIAAGAAPIDAFQDAKVGVAKVIDEAIAQGLPDTANINLKTLHYMIYLGRP